MARGERMKINTRTVKEAGQITIVSRISPQEIDSNPPYGVSYLELFQCRVFAAAFENEVLIQGQVEGRANFTCSRCLNEYPQAIAADYEVTADTQQGDVDLSKEISQAVILALPMKPLCKDKCLGLCPHCGQNLNINSCRCKPDAVHSFPKILKNLNTGL